MGGGSWAKIEANGGGRGVLPAPGAVIEANEGGRRVLGRNQGKQRWERGPSCAWGCNQGERRWEEGPGLKSRRMEVKEGPASPGAGIVENEGGRGVTSSRVVFKRTRGGGGGGSLNLKRRGRSCSNPACLWMSSDKTKKKLKAYLSRHAPLGSTLPS